MPSYRTPDTPTGPEQWKVIAWVLILASLALGGVCIAASLRYASGHPAASEGLRNIGIGLMAMSALGYGAKRLLGRFLG